MAPTKAREPEKGREQERFGRISRREFLKDAGLVVGGTAVGSLAFTSACKSGNSVQTVTVANPVVTTVSGVPITALAETSPSLSLNINGHTYQTEFEPHWTLVRVLQSQLGLTGTKKGCDIGACGACTVIMDGRPVLSCMLLAVECQGKAITTIEGLAAAGDPLIDNLVVADYLQCGFCIPGTTMTCKALLNRIPNPTTADIQAALAGCVTMVGGTTTVSVAEELAREPTTLVTTRR